MRTSLGQVPHDVAETVAELQRIADIPGPSQRDPLAGGRLRIMFVGGSPWAWRAIEFRYGAVARKMLCFRDQEQIQRFLRERLAWQREDEAFVTEHMATAGSLPGITSDWVPSHSFDDLFNAYRLKRMHETIPDRLVVLAHGTRGNAL
jgi:hypothetical protein